MLRLISVDIYKILRSKFFYITLAILLGLSILNVATSTSIIANAAKNQNGFLDAQELANYGKGLFWSHIYNAFSLLGTFVSILSILFFSTEFSHGTMKNIATKGYRREEIYLSKFFVSSLCAFFYFVLTLVISFISTLFAGGTTIPKYYEIGKNLHLACFLIILFLMVYASMGLMFSSLIRKSGSTVAIFTVFDIVVLGVLPGMITIFIREHLKQDINVSNYLCSGCFHDSLGYLSYSLAKEITSADITRILCVAAVFLFISLGIGIYNFKERDI